HRRTVGIGEHHIHLIRQEHNRRDGADVETPKIIVAARIETLEWRRDQATITAQERSLYLETDNVPANFLESLIRKNRPNVLNRATQSCDFTTHIEAISAGRAVGPVDGVDGETGNHLAGNDTLQSVRAGQATERQGL